MRKVFTRKERRWIRGQLKENGYFVIPQERLTKLAASNLSQRNQWFFDLVRAGDDTYWRFDVSDVEKKRRTQSLRRQMKWALLGVGFYVVFLIGILVGFILAGG